MSAIKEHFYLSGAFNKKGCRITTACHSFLHKRLFIIQWPTSLLLNCMLSLPSIYLYSWKEWHLLQQKDVKSVLIKDHWEVVLWTNVIGSWLVHDGNVPQYSHFVSRNDGFKCKTSGSRVAMRSQMLDLWSTLGCVIVPLGSTHTNYSAYWLVVRLVLLKLDALPL